MCQLLSCFKNIPLSWTSILNATVSSLSNTSNCLLFLCVKSIFYNFISKCMVCSIFAKFLTDSKIGLGQAKLSDFWLMSSQAEIMTINPSQAKSFFKIFLYFWMFLNFHTNKTIKHNDMCKIIFNWLDFSLLA